MPDLIIHLAASRLGALPVRSEPVRLGMLLGAALPDVMSKGLVYLTASPTWFVMPTHAPLVYLIIAYASSLLFDARDRRPLFAGLVIGGWLHLLVDYGKDHLMPRTLPLWFPFRIDLYEGDWYYSETSVYATIPALVLFVVLGWVERKSERKRTEAKESGPKLEQPT